MPTATVVRAHLLMLILWLLSLLYKLVDILLEPFLMQQTQYQKPAELVANTKTQLTLQPSLALLTPFRSRKENSKLLLLVFRTSAHATYLADPIALLRSRNT